MSKTSKAREFAYMPTDKIKANYLKYYKLCMRDMTTNYDISQSEMEFMLFAYDYEFFTAGSIAEHMLQSELKLKQRIIYPLLTKDYVYKKYDKLTKTVNDEVTEYFRSDITRFNYRIRYALTQKGRLFVAKFYRKLDGSESIVL